MTDINTNVVPKSNAKSELGQTGENIAAEYLESRGFEILHRNWRIRKLEIDIVALNKGFLVFIEVKTRSGNSHGEATEAVNIKKQKQIIKAANAYFSQYNRKEESRFDIIGIWYQPGYEPVITHLEDAFYPISN